MKFFTNVVELIEQMKKEDPKRIAYRYFREGHLAEVTYGKFIRKIEGITQKIHTCYGERNIIALFGETTYEFMAMYFGILASNNIVVTLDTKLMQEQKKEIFNKMNVNYVFHDSLLKEEQNEIVMSCDTVKEIHNILEYVEKADELEQSESIPINEEDLAQYMFTSGSTGKSKIVMYSYKNIASIAKVQNVPFTLKYDIILSVLPIHHCFELATQITELCCGATICINDSMEKFIDNICFFQPTMMNLVPVQLEELVRNFHIWAKNIGIAIKQRAMTNEEKELFYQKFGKGLERIHSGGAAVRPELAMELEYFGIQLISGLGMTEMCGHVCNNPKMTEKPSSVGIPFRNDVLIEIAKDGEILVKGPNLMMGYYDMDCSEYFTEDGFFKTGDLGRKDAEDYLYIIGRKKNIILLSNGENVYPEELEALVGNIDGVRQVAVFEWENQIACLIYLNDEAINSKVENEIQELNSKLANYKRITKVFYRDTPFPKTATSKIDKQKLIMEFKEANKIQYVPLETDTEKVIANAIREVLGCEKEIGALDNFFALGGNSLIALTVAGNIGIHAQLLYENPVIRDLAKAIEQTEEGELKDESYVNELIQNARYGIHEKPIQNILLTGATGFLGSHVLYELVKQEKSHIICLVRSKQKMKKVYQAYFGENLPSCVKLVIGDITSEMIGMQEEEYKELLEKVDTVIHVAANVRHVGEQEEFMKTNYCGTKNIIKFCKQSDAVLHYVSSYISSGFAVAPIYLDVSEFSERMLYIGQDYKKNIYAHTKYLSEVEILKEREQGLEANIYRMGCLTSRRKDGVFQLNASENGLRKRLRGLLKIGITPRETDWAKIDLTAVDECADAFVRLIYSKKVNYIYHMFNPNVISMKEIAAYCDKTVEVVSKEEFRERVKDHLNDEEIASLSFYTEMLASSKQLHMDSTETVTALKELGFEWGINTKEYVKSFVQSSSKGR